MDKKGKDEGKIEAGKEMKKKGTTKSPSYLRQSINQQQKRLQLVGLSDLA